jgi:hypothetical protein
MNSIFVKENVNMPSRCKSVEKGRIYLLFLDYIKTNFFCKGCKDIMNVIMCLYTFIIVVGGYTRESNYWKIHKSKSDL